MGKVPKAVLVEVYYDKVMFILRSKFSIPIFIEEREP
jgi:hypothetical protein